MKGDFLKMKTKIVDLIDFEKVNTLLEGFNKSTGFVTAILDLDGNVLSKSGWRQICTEFHRINSETSKRCTISDTVLAGKLAKGEKYHFYKCLNGLIDVAVPIVIKGEHIANLFSGQFFFEEPDHAFFKKQAEKYRFNKDVYLKALMDVPVVSEKKVKTVMDFLLNMTLMISEMTFQRMEQTELNEALRKSEERWQFAIEGNGDGLWDWNIQTNEVFLSKQWKNMLGFGEQEIENNFNSWKERLHPDDKLKSINAIQNYLENKADSYTVEYRLLCKDVSYKWVESKGKIISRAPDGKPIRFIGTHSDITERKHAEEKIKKLNKELGLRVKQRTAQLETANKELETFTYSVSHDLKAPLRGIDGYSKLLLDLYGNTLDEEGQSFLATIRHSTMQMNQLIDDLLEYSRLERSPMRNENIKIREFITAVSLLFNEELLAAKITFRVEVPDITLNADSKGLHIALRNLLENAVKFTRGEPNPQIEIGLEEKTSSWVLFVKDNGIGFNMKYQQRIFEIFQRLHRAEDFPGTGIGLAMVSKAMQRMQGNVWAESTPGIGSTFYIEIPKLI